MMTLFGAITFFVLAIGSTIAGFKMAIEKQNSLYYTAYLICAAGYSYVSALHLHNYILHLKALT